MIVEVVINYLHIVNYFVVNYKGIYDVYVTSFHAVKSNEIIYEIRKQEKNGFIFSKLNVIFMDLMLVCYDDNSDVSNNLVVVCITGEIVCNVVFLMVMMD